ncbi:MAG: TIGR03960 family B12-binding radical SAM protein [Ruminococcaceae bacterium]|nr:TIGR03960 family B12-binding radical SAM protein [Oscillospiraceae bacterium]
MELDKILKEVQKPARYVGTEYNSIHKDLAEIYIRFAFCFPDVYEVGMSHLGIKILYHLLNEQSDIYCERVFAPWLDMEEKMREAKIPLFSLESRTPVQEFDIVGFTLQYEMSYSNIINMLDLANIAPLRADRGEDAPIVYAGGPCAYNPEPLADFMDFFMIGESEEQIIEVMDAYRAWKQSGKKKRAFLESIVSIQGIYVPEFYDVSYHDDGTIKEIKPNHPKAPARVKKQYIRDMDKVYYPDTMIVPNMEIIHDRITLELFRGCIRGCRFCQAGMIYRPVRERSPKRLLELAEKLIDSTGYEEISMSSLSTSDYSGLEELTNGLLDLTVEKKINLSLPSLRIDSFSMELMQKVQKVRKSGLTFAPEAGSQRMRDVINKGVTEEDLLRSVSLAFAGGYSGVKLYFMIGLPTETDEDVKAIAHLAHKVAQAYRDTPKALRGKGLRVTVSASSFVPKPFTPFQWAVQDDMETLRYKQQLIKNELRDKAVNFNWHESALSVLEGVFARGDRRLGKVLLRAHKLGIRFDAWHECFHPELWEEAFRQADIDPGFYNRRARSYEEILPWEIIDPGVSRDFLERENERAKRGELTTNCREGCSGCGMKQLGGGGVCD